MTDDKELKDQRIPIMMTASELKAIDDWSFERRIRSRGEAIRRLCQMGLVLDENRDDLSGAMKGAFATLKRVIDFAEETAQSDHMTRPVGNLARSVAELTLDFAKLAPVIGRVSSVAEKFSGDGDLSAIIAETEASGKAWKEAYEKMLAVTEKET